MYNRYIPQPDGSFRRRSVPDTAAPSRTAAPRQPSRPQPPGDPGKPPSQSPSQAQSQAPSQSPSQPRPPRQDYGAGSFLKNLLPQGLCTEDLIVVLLLLLMAGDNRQERSNALLTLALYLLL